MFTIFRFLVLRSNRRSENCRDKRDTECGRYYFEEMHIALPFCFPGLRVSRPVIVRQGFRGGRDQSKMRRVDAAEAAKGMWFSNLSLRSIFPVVSDDIQKLRVNWVGRNESDLAAMVRLTEFGG